MKQQFKAAKPRFSTYFNYEVVDILQRRKLFGLIPIWMRFDTVKNVGQVDELVYLLNNQEVMKERLSRTVELFMK